MSIKALFAFSILVLAVAAVVPTAAADQVLTLETVQKVTLQGQERPEQRSTAQLWIGDGAIARDDGDTRVVLKGDELLLVSHRAQTYSTVELPVDVMAMVPEEMREQVKQRMEQGHLSGDLTPSEETQEVGGWSAHRYDLALTSPAGMTLNVVLWASEDVKVDPQPYVRLTKALATLQPGGDEWVSKLATIKGFPVLRDTTMDADQIHMQSEERLLSVQEKDAPEGTYGAPEGYTEQPFNAPPPGAGS